MGVFDILIIFMKLEEKLKDSSRLYQSYLKMKENLASKQLLEHLEKSLIHIEINDSND